MEVSLRFDLSARAYRWCTYLRESCVQSGEYAYDVAPSAYIRGSKNESAQNTEDRARPVEQKRYVLVERESHERRA